MHRIDSVGAVSVAPAIAGPGPNPNSFWLDENIEAGQEGTVGDQDFFNAIQEELIAVLTAAGITPNKATRNQVITAIQILIARATASLAIANIDTGAVNAIVLAPTPAIAAREPGQLIAFVAGHANTGASTINDGLGAVALERNDGSPVQAGDLLAAQPALVWWDGAAYRIIEMTASQASAIAAALANAAETAAETYAAAQASAAQAAAEAYAVTQANSAQSTAEAYALAQAEAAQTAAQNYANGLQPTFTANGYGRAIIYPNGWGHQWGVVSVAGNGGTTVVTLPVEFANTCDAPSLAMQSIGSTAGGGWCAYGYSRTGFTIQNNTNAEANFAWQCDGH